MKKVPEYSTPQGFRCPVCGELCQIVPLLNEFSYSGTHCTGGLDGTEYPPSWGNPVCDQCLASVDDYEYDKDYE